MHVGAGDPAAADAARSGAGQLRDEFAVGRAEALHELCGVREHLEPLGVARAQPGLPGARCAALRSNANCTLCLAVLILDNLLLFVFLFGIQRSTSR